MPINWNSLTPIPAPQVVATLPSQPAGPADGGLLSGVLSGLQQGQQIQAQQQQMAAQKQQMSQSAELHPGQLAIQRQTIANNQLANQKGQIELTAMQQKAQDAEKLRQGAMQGMAQYSQVLKQTNPVDYVAFQSAQEDVVSKQAKTKADLASMHTTQLQNHITEGGILGSAAGALMSTQDPQQQAAIWDIQKKRLAQAGIDASLYPQTPDKNWAVVTLGVQSMNTANVIDNELAKKPSDLKAAQKDVRDASKALEQARASGDKKAIEQAQVEFDQAKTSAEGVANKNTKDSKGADTALGKATEYRNHAQTIYKQVVDKFGEDSEEAQQTKLDLEAAVNDVEKEKSGQPGFIEKNVGFVLSPITKGFKALTGGSKKSTAISNGNNKPTDLDSMAKEAIANGADPKAVQARLQELKNGKR